jgi:peptide deformylase
MPQARRSAATNTFFIFVLLFFKSILYYSNPITQKIPAPISLVPDPPAIIMQSFIIVLLNHILYIFGMQILTLGNEKLKQKALPVKKIGPEYQKIAKELISSLHAEEGIGLAGPQVGILERIFAIHVEGDEPRIFINPSIMETSQETAKFEEGCLSIPGIYSDVARPKTIKIQAWNEMGRSFVLEATGIAARVILHEYDHLEGILFIDRLPEQKRNRLIEKYEKARIKALNSSGAVKK